MVLIKVCFELLAVLAVISSGCSLMLIPKKCALIVELSLCVSLGACMHIPVCIYEGVSVCFFALTCAVFTVLLLHTMT